MVVVVDLLVEEDVSGVVAVVVDVVVVFEAVLVVVSSDVCLVLAVTFADVGDWEDKDVAKPILSF